MVSAYCPSVGLSCFNYEYPSDLRKNHRGPGGEGRWCIRFRRPHFAL